MSNLSKLKKKAAELEERRQYDKALAIYEQVLNSVGNSDEEVDVSLFNRVGDLTLRQGNVTQAVGYYERAVDLYTEGGFFNNAIALCNKILRNAPGRTSIYYKLGKISARKGFTSDAKLNFLEYADRMQKGGHWEEAFSALEEFANLCPDQDDVRLMLAEQLTRQNKKPEALEQLQILYSRYLAEDRTTEANATLARMRAIDPDVVPQVAQRAAPEKSGDLVFLDVSYDAPAPTAKYTPGGSSTPAQPPHYDPRASGEMRSLDSGGPIGYGNIITDDGGSSAPELIRSITPLPIHDLALAGILPVLDTPGLESIPPQVFDFDVDSGESDAVSVLNVEYGGLLPAFNADGNIPKEHSSDRPAIEMPEIVRSLGEAIELESRSSQSDLLIVHGSAPGTDRGSGDGVGAASLGDLLPTVDAGALELNSSLSHTSLKSIAESESELAALISVEPDDFTLHRRLGEVLVEDGRRMEGLASLETAMNGFEDAGNIADALSVAEEILRVEPNSIRHHQKRVEYSFRNDDQSLLVDSYMELADALFRTAQLQKAAVVYERVLELSPDNPRAKNAAAALAAGPKTKPSGEATIVPTAPRGQAIFSSPEPEEQSGDFVNLGDLLREDDVPRSTRMVVDEEAPSGDEEADFAEMLDKFKRGLAENVDDEDYQSHYDLGVAFREMGLLDEAIAQFQRALRGATSRVRTLESLGHCFVEKSQFQVAVNVLERALTEEAQGDENLVGVLYLLGYSSEAMQKYSDALQYYQRVFMVDIQFRDVTTRISALEKMVK